MCHIMVSIVSDDIKRVDLRESLSKARDRPLQRRLEAKKSIVCLSDGRLFSSRVTGKKFVEVYLSYVL